MKRILYYIVFVILTLVLLVNIFSLFGVSLFGFRLYKVGSGSMNPYLKVNDITLIKDSSDYKIGDVVTFKNGDEYVTHRIVSIDVDKVVTKGDANNVNDEPITKDKIVGKLIYKFRIFSFISFIIYKPVLWIFIFVIGVIVIYTMPGKKID